MSICQLFGGYMNGVLPHSRKDVSEMREVPDNQEIFAHEFTDQSMIVEILQHVDENDESAIRVHFDDLADSNDAKGNHSKILSVEEINIAATNMKHASSAYHVQGWQCVAKFKESVRNKVEIHLGIFRLPDHETDIIVSFNNSLLISQGSSSHKPVPVSAVPWTAEDFKALVMSLRIDDISFLNQ